jgi:hypothetical protein
LTPNKRGRGEEITGKEKRRMGTIVCLFGLTACMAKKLLRKDGLPKRLPNRKSESCAVN